MYTYIYFVVKKEKRYRPIRLPLTFILNSDAQAYLDKNSIPSTTVRLSDGRNLAGIRISTYHLSFLQRFIVNGDLVSAEVRVKDIAQDRTPFVDITKSFIYAALYRSFDDATLNHLNGQGVIVEWNRSHPQWFISLEKRDDPRLQRIVQSRPKKVTMLYQTILGYVREYIKKSLYLSTENEQHILDTALRMCREWSPITTHLLTCLKTNKKVNSILRGVVRSLCHKLEQTRISDYFAMLLVELAIQFSRTNSSLSHLLPYQYERPTNSDATYIQNGSPSTYVIWNFSQRQNVFDERIQLRIALSNKRSQYHNLHLLISSASAEIRRHPNIQEYYFTSRDPDKEAKLGLSYLGYVEKECQNLNVHFESFVNTIPNIDQTLFNLLLWI